MTRSQRQARLLALIVPLALLAGAWSFQLWGGLFPCEMCLWQRWPHYAAILVAALAFMMPPRVTKGLVGIAALLIAISGVIAVYHAGVEYRWWHGVTACTGTLDLAGLTPAQRLDRIMGTPVVPCDVAQWTLGGISLAGFNALISLGTAATIAILLGKRR
ncbi:disulfide bond formation protein B [Sphingomonas oligophenolica]|uniref:Disulfide bond formation protein B n=1 Tax=Sphingomonas oligophenolica TaxID=301154 RepID=A0A502CCE6_9SPHN|nr:disulfide bond formation protein B [Sphingomonas oligophenolica]TPG10380.1 disulfide bond formation protein B [Sphingomonas oligophenolica]